MNWKRFTAFTFALLAVLLLSYQPAHAQSNVQAGSIQGVVTDPQGGVVPNAKVTITNKDTGAAARYDDDFCRDFYVGFARAGKLYGSGRSAELQDRDRNLRRADQPGVERADQARTGRLEHGRGSERPSDRREYRPGASFWQLDHTTDREFADQRPEFPRPGATRTRRSDSGRRQFRSDEDWFLVDFVRGALWPQRAHFGRRRGRERRERRHHDHGRTIKRYR